LLLEAGAEVGAKNANGSTALHMAIVHDAAVETIELLLRSGAGDQIEVENEFGYTPMRVAVERRREEVVRVLREFLGAG